MTLRIRAVVLLALLAACVVGFLAVDASGTAAHGAASTSGVDPDADPVGEWPLRPEPDVVRPFEQPPSPYAAGHRGVDLAGAAGQWVGAALPGTITYAGLLAGRGVVVVDHGVTRTTYQPVSATVAIGDVVSAGDPIGRLEVAGSHCLPHACLHWGWVEGDTYLDPLRLVGAGPVRLLPLWRDRPVDPGAAPSAPRAPPGLPYAGWQALRDLFVPSGLR